MIIRKDTPNPDHNVWHLQTLHLVKVLVLAPPVIKQLLRKNLPDDDVNDGDGDDDIDDVNDGDDGKNLGISEQMLKILYQTPLSCSNKI